ncbi:MAG: hypothetical protein H7A34_04290 [bacterium]|nr:hypothetical protein [bacterium]
MGYFKQSRPHRKTKNYIYILNLKIKQKLSNARHHLTALSQHKVFAEPENRIKQLQQHIDDIEFRIHNHMKHLVELYSEQIIIIYEKLTAFSPSAILARGYSIVTKLGDAQVVKSVKSINPGSRLKSIWLMAILPPLQIELS